MGLLDVLFKTAGNAAKRAVAQKATEIIIDEIKEKAGGMNIAKSVAASESAAKAAQTSSKYDTTPDMPQQFGYNMGWLCIKGSTTQEVISALNLKNPQPANWQSGIKAVHANLFKKVFISPVVNGYVLAIGYVPFGVMETAKQELNALSSVSANFDEMHCFTTQRTVDIHVWAKYVKGELVRGYGWLGESGIVYLNEGELTPEEINLGFTNLIQTPDCDWDTVDIPDEESIMRISAAWGVDTSFSDGNYQTGTGYVCEK